MGRAYIGNMLFLGKWTDGFYLGGIQLASCLERMGREMDQREWMDARETIQDEMIEGLCGGSPKFEPICDDSLTQPAEHPLEGYVRDSLDIETARRERGKNTSLYFAR